MPRREIVTIREMQERRGNAWERSYRLHKTAQSIIVHGQPLRILAAITRHLPPPEMQIDGYLYRPLDVIRGEAAAALEVGISVMHKELMCAWYWTDGGWDRFVDDYQNLPEVTEPYYWTYDAERDGAILLPVSAKPPRSDARYNLGTTEVQVSNLYLDQE